MSAAVVNGIVMLTDRAQRGIAAAAMAAVPVECCGALIGERVSEAMTIVESIVPIVNPLRFRYRDRYLVAADDWLRVSAPTGGSERLVGFYHSHPGSAPIPSTLDREAAWPWYAYLIVSMLEPQQPAFRAWRLADDRTDFLEQYLTVVPSAPIA